MMTIAETALQCACPCHQDNVCGSVTCGCPCHDGDTTETCIPPVTECDPDERHCAWITWGFACDDRDTRDYKTEECEETTTVDQGDPALPWSWTAYTDGSVRCPHCAERWTKADQ